MKIHELSPKNKKVARKRRGMGNGTGNGTYGGRGCNGQNARSGGGVRLGFEGGQTPLMQRMPKKRGFNNPNRVESQEVSLSALEAAYKDGETVSFETLFEKGLIKSGKSDKVKILGNGELKKKLKIESYILMSASARKAIEKAGGSQAGETAKAAPKKESKPTPKAAKASDTDDLTKIEGIGPKIQEALQGAGVNTYADLAGTKAEKISEIIADVRGTHVTDTWPAQAEMARDGKWDELKKWQDELDGGKA